jgi:hypothetical protein
MFKLTPTGVETIKNCKEKTPHSHGWKQVNSRNVIFFDENQLAKCIVEEKQMQTKEIRRQSEYNNVVKVLNGVQVSEKIEPKAEKYKFTERFYASTAKFNGFSYFVMIPNPSNVLTTLYKMNELAQIKKYTNQRAVICCKSPKIILGSFSKLLL